MAEKAVHNPLYSDIAYDDAFRTMETECDDIVIPFINYFFDEEYGKDAVIRRLRNEQYIEHKDHSYEKRITDSHMEITQDGISKRYHLECESSKYDGSILVRLFGYDAQIAKLDAEGDSSSLKVKIPYTGLLLLRESPKAPERAKIIIETPVGSTFYYVNIIRESDYSINYIFEKRLYLLIPFYIFNYEKEFSGINDDERRIQNMVDMYREIVDRLYTEVEKKQLSERSRNVIIKLTHKVIYKLLMKHERIQEKVGDFMGGKVLDLPEIVGYREGKAEGRAEGKAEGRAEGEEERRKLQSENELLRLLLEKNGIKV